MPSVTPADAAPAAALAAIGSELRTPHLPRRAHFTRLSRAVRALLANLALGAVLFCVYYATRDLNDLSALRTHGVPATARVTRLEERQGKSTSHLVHYVFPVPGRVIAGVDVIGREEYAATRVGDERTVTYLPGDPDTFRLGGVGDSRVGEQRGRWAAGALGAAALFGGIFALVESDHRKHLRLLREGIPVAAPIVGGRVTRGRDAVYYLTYRLDLSPGATFSRGVQVPKEWYDRYQAGALTEWTVLYDPANPGRHLPYHCITAARLDGA